MSWLYKRIFIGVLIVHLLGLAIFGVRCSRDAGEESQPESEAAEAVEELTLTPWKESAAARVVEERVPLTFNRENVLELPESISSAGARSGLLVELPSGRVLWEMNPEEPVQIASMTKIMTALLAFEDVADRDDLTMETVIQVSKAAYSIGGSQVWLDPRESFSLRELLISIMVKSANDSAYLVGEYLENGSMPAFVARMNDRAAELGMTRTHFFNAHGLPADKGAGNTASCLDLARLARELLPYRKAMEWASIKQHTFRPEAVEPTILVNHNRLVGRSPGVDGLKTGYTREAGFCTTVTCERQGRRLVAIVTGFGKSSARDNFVAQLLEWGYRQ